MPSSTSDASPSSRGLRCPKKRKATPAAASVEVSWTVCCLDGATFLVALPEDTRVAEAKRVISRLREVSQYAMELFVEGKEEPLDDEKRLTLAEKVPLFMLPKDASDRGALVALFKSCGGEDWKHNDGWMTDADLGEWWGVTVDAEGRVIRLDLTRNNLAGPLPRELQQLSALKRLYLQNNKLTGRIPAQLGHLEALTQLRLHSNELNGPIPDQLRQLGALRGLCLQDNQLSDSEAFRFCASMEAHIPGLDHTTC